MRAGEAILRGTFVCEYIGEVLDEQEANRRRDRFVSLFEVLFKISFLFLFFFNSLSLYDPIYVSLGITVKATTISWTWMLILMTLVD